MNIEGRGEKKAVWRSSCLIRTYIDDVTQLRLNAKRQGRENVTKDNEKKGNVKQVNLTKHNLIFSTSAKGNLHSFICHFTSGLASTRMTHDSFQRWHPIFHLLSSSSSSHVVGRAKQLHTSTAVVDMSWQSVYQLHSIAFLDASTNLYKRFCPSVCSSYSSHSQT